jgi:hypothetical protein
MYKDFGYIYIYIYIKAKGMSKHAQCYNVGDNDLHTLLLDQ